MLPVFAQFLIALLLAVIPAAGLLSFIMTQERRKPESFGFLACVAGAGVLTVYPAIVPEVLAELICNPLAEFGNWPQGISCAVDAFFETALIEEGVKFFVLWLFVMCGGREKSPWSILLWSVFISLGFAVTENIFYVWSEEIFVDRLAVGLARFVYSVPAHFLFAVMMGFWFTLARWNPRQKRRNFLLALAVPIVAHGFYDFPLFWAEATESLSCEALCFFFANLVYVGMWILGISILDCFSKMIRARTFF